MKYILPIIAAIIFSSCSKSNNGTVLPYDLPPTAPIPPVKYCFEQKGNSAQLELNIVGDSAFGKISHASQSGIADGNFAGVIYGKTLIVNHKFKSDSGWQNQEQQWKFLKDSVYQVGQQQAGETEKRSTFFIVPCK